MMLEVFRKQILYPDWLDQHIVYHKVILGNLQTMPHLHIYKQQTEIHGVH